MHPGSCFSTLAPVWNEEKLTYVYYEDLLSSLCVSLLMFFLHRNLTHWSRNYQVVGASTPPNLQIQIMQESIWNIVFTPFWHPLVPLPTVTCKTVCKQRPTVILHDSVIHWWRLRCSWNVWWCMFIFALVSVATIYWLNLNRCFLDYVALYTCCLNTL